MQEQARAPTAQQQLVLEEKRLGLAMADQARYNLDARAMALLQAAGLILVLVGLVQVLNGGPSPGPLPTAVITIVAMGCFYNLNEKMYVRIVEEIELRKRTA